MNEKQQLVHLLHHYISKYHQIQDTNQEKELFAEFRQFFESLHHQQEQQMVLYSSQQFSNNQNIAHFHSQIVNLEMSVESIRFQREQVHHSLDLREKQLQSLEISIKSNNHKAQPPQQLDDLIEGVQMCKEKCALLQEENEEFTKMALHLRKQHTESKSRHSNIQAEYENNLLTLADLQQQGLSLNYRMMKQLKIIHDLQYFIKSKCGETLPQETKRNKIDNFVSDYCPLEDTYIKTNSEKFEIDVRESLNQIIALKRELASLNTKDQSDNSYQQDKDMEGREDQVLVSSTFRFRTHHNLGEKLIRQRQISQQQHDFRAFSELDEGEEIVEDQSSESEACIQVQQSPRQPWHCRMVSIQRKDTSEKKVYCKSQRSIASFSSNSSFNKLGGMTLKEEFQSIYQQPQVYEEDDIKEKDTEINDSNELPSVIQQQSILEDSTILINRKSCREIESPKEESNILLKIQIVGVVIATVGFAGWLYKKYF